MSSEMLGGNKKLIELVDELVNYLMRC